MSSKQLVLAVLILALGILAALPFRHSRAPAPPAAAIDARSTDLTLRQRDITLQASPESELSPATGLDALAPPEEDIAGGRSDESRRRPETLEALGSPPTMPSVFRSLVLPAASQRRPIERYEPRATVTGWADPSIDAAIDAPVPSVVPREHRIVDGDTLELLAKQYLGDAGRARDLFDANRDVLDDPQVLPLGKVIHIPNAAADLQPVRFP